ncbi:MAG: hypothetical protein E7C66_02275 [Negativicoccus succinicivorans]|uniref:hypothetical protein n=2 Tax=Negativicoccus succinicivorans TaxID=620903 RepID=UPI00050D96EC|nr:hypothetical protein [Negativicoccus succinicivorans]KGF12068.1 hypothetical protein HMPREF1633_02845 [Tissierellia bacterium S5-A11]MDU2183447.1 hypothetical protein [Negativicoccus succinicivorans]MDU2643392.1 hypothetical protein [Negativicoccus succinicivorans]
MRMGQYMQADANYFNGAYDAQIVPPQPDSRGVFVDCTKRLSAQDQKELRGYFEGYRPQEAREAAAKYLAQKYGEHVFEVVFVTSDNGKAQYRVMVGRNYLKHRLNTKAAKEQQ